MSESIAAVHQFTNKIEAFLKANKTSIIIIAVILAILLLAVCYSLNQTYEKKYANTLEGAYGE